jgi:hypothetical protein
MPDQAPDIHFKPGDGPRLVYDKERKAIVAQPAAGEMRMDLMLEKIDGENGEAFKDMCAHIWAAGASHEDADFITRMLARKGLYLFQTEPWKRCPSTHCERRGECSSARDCTIKTPIPRS